MSDSAQPKLTKKQKKALEFRKGKGKSKAADNQADVPEEENLDSIEASGSGNVEEAPSKKRKREKVEAEEGVEGTVEGEAVVEGEGERKKKRQRGKKKSQRDREDNGVGKDGKPRLLLFVGNLPFKVSTEAIQAHFSPCGETPLVRLLTSKSDSKPKGCAFIEFSSPLALQAALKLHESDFGSRKINVELTAGGGGNSDARKEKIEVNRKKMELEREKAAANKRKREGLPEGADKDKSLRWKKADVVAKEEEPVKKEELKTRKAVVNGKKVRDRRIPKVDAEGNVKERKRKAEAKLASMMSGPNAIRIGGK